MAISPREPRHRGAVAVVVRQGRFLVIRRAEGIAAPGAYCFPGGGIEPGETDEDALRREIREELGAEIRPLRCVWRSVTTWRVDLAWWAAELDAADRLAPHPGEVASVHWLSIEEMLALPELLESNRQFLDALAAGQVVLD
jgi:8-oxo-dGTP diphosphatase